MTPHTKSTLTWMACVVVAICAVTLVAVKGTIRHYTVLDSTLGNEAWNPAKLLQAIDRKSISQGDSSDDDKPQLPVFQNEALLRLLDLQKRNFGHAALPLSSALSYSDHPYAEISTKSDTQIIVEGTGTWEPNSGHDRSALAWRRERFTFSPRGELLSREACPPKPEK